MAERQEQPVAEFEALLDYLKRTRGFDFAAYKRSSLMRRVQKRLQTLKIEGYPDYVDYLEVHPEEFTQLFNTILINVTDFFRDPPAWEALTNDIIPRILEQRRPEEPIRIWSAGCSAGQEAYSLAIVFAEALGDEAFRLRVKIYGTDADEEALNEARQAAYAEPQMQNVPEELRAKYFEPLNERFCFRRDLRRSVIFGRHDLLQDAPISRVDLLVCRNTLMYFNAEAQARILSRFDFALNGGGFLFLGKAEVLLTRSSAFIPVDLKRRLFAKLANWRGRDGAHPGAETAAEAQGDGPGSGFARLREVAAESEPLAQLLIDEQGRLALANAQARLIFGLNPEDVGKRMQDLQLPYRPVDLLRLADQAGTERRAVMLKDVEWTPPSGETRFLDATVTPLVDASGARLGLRATLADVTRYRHLQDELHHSRQEIETTNEELQSSNEELETTNEELQSTVEELETTNEELQSTNEEMETMNEELQSTNEELSAINDELRRRGEELKGLNAFLESVMSGLKEGVVVVDRDLEVLEWNRTAEDLWGLRADEVRGKNFLNLDIGLPVDRIRQPVWDCLSERSEHEDIVLDATNRRGKAIRVKVSCSRLTGGDNRMLGVIVMMQELRSGED